MITVDSPVASVFGKSHQKRKLVHDGLGLESVGDLLFHFPRRYVKTNELSEVAEPTEGEPLSVVGRITASEVKTFQDRRTRRLSFRVEVRITTDGPDFSMSFFTPHKGQAESEAARMAVGRFGMFTGKAKRFGRSWQIASPHSVVFDPEEAADDAGGASGLADSLRGLLPVYPVTAKLYSWDVQKVVQLALDLVDEVPDVLPDDVRRAHGLLDVTTALRWIHAPDDYEQVGAAQKRFRFEEALVTQLVLARRRAEQRELGARARTGGGGLLEAFDARLPFELTRGQREVGEQVEADLARDHPMHRLLQGEVGSGKTLVALRAMLRVVDSGGQAALLAPTEVLAQQHHRSIGAMLGDLAAGGMLGGAAEATGLALLTGSMTKAQRQEAMLRTTTGEAGIVIGTHALLEGGVEFADLGLVVVDEQHRFGVEQRAALTDKAGTPPHVLVMTATPIPRTVAMTVFGDLETSVLDELPAGRAPIQTTVVPLAEQPHWVERVWQRVREEVAAGHQAYVVCPRISGDVSEQGESDQLDLDEDDNPVPSKAVLTAVTELVEELAAGPLSGAAGRPAPRPDGPRRQGPHDARLRRRRGRRPGLDDRGRGRRRRRQRHHDGADGRRPVRGLPAPPAAGPGRPGRPAGPVPAGQPRRGRLPGPGAARRRGGHHRRLRAEPCRPRAAPRGRRPRALPERVPVQPADTPGAARREDDRRRARGGGGAAGGRSAARRGARVGRSGGGPGAFGAV